MPKWALQKDLELRTFGDARGELREVPVQLLASSCVRQHPFQVLPLAMGQMP
jgi:hypothetical protein